jgi:hypothetical protein
MTVRMREKLKFLAHPILGNVSEMRHLFPCISETCNAGIILLLREFMIYETEKVIIVLD